MTDNQEIKLFQEKGIRTFWDLNTQRWYISVSDVVEELTDCDPEQYIKKLKRDDDQLKSDWDKICRLVPFKNEDGKTQMGIGSSTEGIFRIIQSIRSPKAEPFKLKLAELAAARVTQRFNP